MPRKPKAVTKRKGELLGVQVDAPMKRNLEDLARTRDIPVAQIVREAVKQYLDREQAA